MAFNEDDATSFLDKIREGLTEAESYVDAAEATARAVRQSTEDRRELGDYVRLTAMQMADIGRLADAVSELRAVIPPSEFSRVGGWMSDVEVVNYATRQVSGARELLFDASTELLSARAEAEAVREELNELRAQLGTQKSARTSAVPDNPLEAMQQLLKDNPEVAKSVEDFQTLLQQLFRGFGGK